LHSTTFSAATPFPPPQQTRPDLHICPSCMKAYKHAGDCARHQREIHSDPKFHCHIDRCPRSVAGEGFGRMHHLVAHLKSNKHKMDAKEAAYAARQHNLPKSRARQMGESSDSLWETVVFLRLRIYAEESVDSSWRTEPSSLIRRRRLPAGIFHQHCHHRRVRVMMFLPEGAARVDVSGNRRTICFP
jgi:hypothetical protein